VDTDTGKDKGKGVLSVRQASASLVAATAVDTVAVDTAAVADTVVVIAPAAVEVADK